MRLSDRLWQLCHSLRHEGVDYGEYLDQLANLICVRLLDSSSKSLAWKAIVTAEQAHVVQAYDDALKSLADDEEPMRSIFAHASNLIRDPVALRKLVHSIDIACTSDASDLLATTFEELLYRSGSEGKRGAGQYFTPRAVGAVVATVIRPWATTDDDLIVADPAAGVGGFLVAAQRAGIATAPGRRYQHRVTYLGTEIARRPQRLGAMNFLVHGIKGRIVLADALKSVEAPLQADVIVTNPPFGVRGGNKPPERPDFWYKTTNKQLNFLQHVVVSLRSGGRAAIVLPDSVLRAPALVALWEPVLAECNLHTVLRLPDHTFAPYAPSIRTVVLFFTKGTPSARTWIYDARAAPNRKVDGYSERFADFARRYGRNAVHPSGKARAAVESEYWYSEPSEATFLGSGSTMHRIARDETEPIDAEVQARGHLRRARYELETALEAVLRLGRAK